jgi:hypothetical protein
MLDMQWVNIDGVRVLQYRYKIGESLVTLNGGLGTTTYNEDVFSGWQTVKEPKDT